MHAGCLEPSLRTHTACVLQSGCTEASALLQARCKFPENYASTGMQWRWCLSCKHSHDEPQPHDQCVNFTHGSAFSQSVFELDTWVFGQFIMHHLHYLGCTHSRIHLQGHVLAPQAHGRLRGSAAAATPAYTSRLEGPAVAMMHSVRIGARLATAEGCKSRMQAEDA